VVRPFDRLQTHHEGWTLQELIDERMTLTAFCRGNHHQVLDLEALKARLGADAPAMAADLVPRLKCKRCGEKAVGITYSPDSRPKGETSVGQSSRKA
jgi:hypothetical protein